MSKVGFEGNGFSKTVYLRVFVDLSARPFHFDFVPFAELADSSSEIGAKVFPTSFNLELVKVDAQFAANLKNPDEEMASEHNTSRRPVSLETREKMRFHLLPPWIQFSAAAFLTEKSPLC